MLVTGGSGPSGIAAARALRDAGHTVFTVGSDGPRIEAAAAEAGDGVTPLVCDLADLAEVRSLHASGACPAGRNGRAVDGVIHLVGGWRGAKGITDQSDEDWDFLERSAITTLRNVTRVFYDDLAASDAGRFAMVSSTAVGSRRRAAPATWRPRPPPRPGPWPSPTASAAARRAARTGRRGTAQRRRRSSWSRPWWTTAMRGEVPGTQLPRLHRRRGPGRRRRRALRLARGGTQRPAAAAGPLSPRREPGTEPGPGPP